MTQRQLEVDDPHREESTPAPAPSATTHGDTEAPPSPPPLPPVRSPTEPIPPSNRELLQRQEKWFQERSKLESRRRTGEGSS